MPLPSILEPEPSTREYRLNIHCPNAIKQSCFSRKLHPLQMNSLKYKSISVPAGAILTYMQHVNKWMEYWRQSEKKYGCRKNIKYRFFKITFIQSGFLCCACLVWFIWVFLMKRCVYVFFSLKDKQQTEGSIGECGFCTGINVTGHS